MESIFVSEYGGIPFYFGDRILCVFDLAKLRQKKSGHETTVTFEIVGEPLNAELIETLLAIHALIDRHLKEYASPDSGLPTDYSSSDQVPEKFKRIVFMLIDWIEQLRRKVKHLELANGHLSRADAELCRQAATSDLAEFFARSFRPIYISMAEYSGGEKVEDYQLAPS